MNQKNAIQGQDRGKEEQVLSFKFPLLPFVQTAKAQSTRIQFAKNADIITENRLSK